MRKLLIVLLALAACSRDLAFPGDPGPLPEPDALTVESTTAQVAPRGSVRLQVSGGTPPYAIEPLLHPGTEVQPQALLDADVLEYRAGDAGGVVDEVVVRDAGEQAVTVRFAVGPELIIIPAYAAVNANARLPFQVTGGQPPYTFLLADRQGGGSTSSLGQDGNFVAGFDAGSVDVVVEDALHTMVRARVSIGPGVSIFPASVEIGEGGSAAFEAFGGDPPYTYSLVLPVPVEGITISPGTGTLDVEPELVRPEGWDGRFWVEASDGGPRPARAEVLLRPALEPPPDPGVVAPGAALRVEPTGGTPPYLVRFAWAGNLSGGVIEGDVYRAGPNPRVTDHLEIQDANDRSVTLDVRVGDLRLERSRYEGIIAPDLSPRLGRARMQNGQIFLPGANLRIGEHGGLEPHAFPAGRLHDVIATESAGGFMAIAGSSPTRDFTYLYGAIAGGDVQLAGGGRTVAGAAFFPTAAGLDVGVAGGLGCGSGWTAVGGFIASGTATCFTGGYFTGLMAYAQNTLWLTAPRRQQRYTIGLGPPATWDRSCTIGTMEETWASVVAPLRGIPFEQEPVAFGRSALSLDHVALATCLSTGEVEAELASLSLDARLIGAPATPPLQRAPVYIADGPRLYAVELARGDAAFTAPRQIHEGDTVVAGGDLDGDMGFDLLTRDGLGTFEIRFDALEKRTGNGNRFRAGPSAQVILLPGDVDRDGAGDLLALSGGRIRVLLAVEDDGPALATVADLSADTLARVVGLADVTGDGLGDLLGVDGGGFLVARDLDDLTDAFLPPRRLADLQVGALGALPVQLEQGRTDLLVPRTSLDGWLTGADVVLPGEGAHTALVLDDPVPVTEVKAGDVTGDGLPDLVVLGACPSHGCHAPLYLHRGGGDRAGFTLGPAESLGTASAPGRVLLDEVRGRVVLVTRIPFATKTDDYPLEIDVIVPGGAPLHATLPITAEGILSAGPELVRLAEVDASPGPELLVPANDSGLDFDPGNELWIVPFAAGGALDVKARKVHTLAPRGASVSWLPIDVNGDGLVDLATMSGPPPGMPSGPRAITLLRNDGRGFVR